MSTATAIPQPSGRTPADTFPFRLVTMRAELGMEERGKILPVDVIAERCDIAPATWSTWERGTTPQNLLEVVAKIAKGTGYDRDWIAWGFSLRRKRELALLQGGARATSRNTQPPLLSLVPLD